MQDILEYLATLKGNNLLQEIARASLKPENTDILFTRYNNQFPDTCARWVSLDENFTTKLAAFARILPYAPYLAEYSERFLRKPEGHILDIVSANVISYPDESEILELLLGVFRLLVHDNEGVARYVQPAALQMLLAHSSRPVRYLAIRIICLYLHAADAATEDMISKYLGDAAINGAWERKEIDYRFLSLWEESRDKKVIAQMSFYKTERPKLGAPWYKELGKIGSDIVVNLSGTLMPFLETASLDPTYKPVLTPTTNINIKNISKCLLDSKPLLLTGLPGSGKSFLVKYIAERLNKLENMITLHLNEQSDAKLLVGMYTTGSKPGSFTWKPGILTTAVREGRWVLIEDLDRAPPEIISFLLPLVERNELLIPNRDEIIKARSGFRIIATMRSSRNLKGDTTALKSSFLGQRFWNTVALQSPSSEEFAAIATEKYPRLGDYIPSIMRVYDSIHIDRAKPDRTIHARPVSSRDLLKWCDRINALERDVYSPSIDLFDEIFLEAYDCFASSFPMPEHRNLLMHNVAKELHIDPQRRDHLLFNREIFHQLSKSTGKYHVGRIGLTYLRSRRMYSVSRMRPFSMNPSALRTLEQIAAAVNRREPLLLVGETGTGKTTCIQQLAEILGHKLVAFNLSQQSESGDLLGGYKPINIRNYVIPMKDEFDELFQSTFSLKKNHRYLDMLAKRAAKSDWKRVCLLWKEALKMVASAQSRADSGDNLLEDNGQPSKKRKLDHAPSRINTSRWEKFAIDLKNLEALLSSGSGSFAFSFVEGAIVKAVRNGDWVLLDEINLASPDTLEALADLLDSGDAGVPSLLLSEKGDAERVRAHPEFRIFAAMNPATDVAKKDLPLGIRSRFTEIYVDSPDRDERSLLLIVETYLKVKYPGSGKISSTIAELYRKIQGVASQNDLVDGAGQKTNYSLRTLTRALTYAADVSGRCSLRRALYDGFLMSFSTSLNAHSERILVTLVQEYVFGKHLNSNSEILKPLKAPTDGEEYVQEGRQWVRKGPLPMEDVSHYIVTPFVQRNLDNLIRAVSSRKYPILIQGPTSSGKTSMVEYLAKKSGNHFVRINNHEHTDLQEYFGTYISGDDGRLFFREGILVKALREGYWVVLDELNLAPTDVLEALNRLLDENRELLIPETQEVVRPHKDFMLFATQNPAGLYGGRKFLSRAFLNRFLELHFDDIPVEELVEILHRRTLTPESWCKRIVNVYRELSVLRQEDRIFEQKSFATLRDLFRWALRKADTVQELAINGFMLLAERVRKPDERESVRKIIEAVMSRSGPKVAIDETSLYDSNGDFGDDDRWRSSRTIDIVRTEAMTRLYTLVVKAVQNNEPILLIGETGVGKTTVFQLLAQTAEKQLFTVNAHQNTETGDIIGAQRPVRNRALIEQELSQELMTVLGENISGDVGVRDLLERYDSLSKNGALPLSEISEKINTLRNRLSALFEWSDGTLVQAMKSGQYFLLDEISLADDSVLERLNSVLEPSRAILLAEKGPDEGAVFAKDGFQLFATMNPGGDYGKKELSPALRNRFTEIWVPPLTDTKDVTEIVKAKLVEPARKYTACIVQFAMWFNGRFNFSAGSTISIRDMLALVSFVNRQILPIIPSIVHGIAMVYIDTLGANPAALIAVTATEVIGEKTRCLEYLGQLLGEDVLKIYQQPIDVYSTETQLQIGSFHLEKLNSGAYSQASDAFTLSAPTTRTNAMRVARALQLNKPVLLEGSPGVGKTSLIVSLAKATDKPLTRINLSDQTDLIDLFGSDVPIEGESAGLFRWRDGPFLTAMKNGDWVLLDEMNLASQSILEGLNSCLDHRGQVYISELDQMFHKHKDFRLFAAQNPHHQGGGRKGLPASFVNRFTVVYADVFSPEDSLIICRNIFPNMPHPVLENIVGLIRDLEHNVTQMQSFGVQGRPWEFNLRDILKWLQLLNSSKGLLKSASPHGFFNTIVLQRFRSRYDRERALWLCESYFGPTVDSRPYHNVSGLTFQVGYGLLQRGMVRSASGMRASDPDFLQQDLNLMESLMLCVQNSWPVILVGTTGAGKSRIIQKLASIVGEELIVFPMNADIDAMDLIGGYEHFDPSRRFRQLAKKVSSLIQSDLIQSLVSTSSVDLSCDFFNELSLAFSENVVDLSVISNILSQIKSRCPSQLGDELLKECKALQNASQIDTDAKFAWVDGVLIRALQEGRWLLLDNANLCNSSVLDRLNSLLESDGHLSVNEHCDDEGRARLIKPHPNFKIFLTVDPKYGELSRAMRNRAVELCVLPSEDRRENSKPRHMSSFLNESSTYRFRALLHAVGDGHAESKSSEITDIALEHLSFQDTKFLESFFKQTNIGLSKKSFDADFEEIEPVAGTSVRSPTKTILQNRAAFQAFPSESTLRGGQILPNLASITEDTHGLKSKDIVPSLHLNDSLEIPYDKPMLIISAFLKAQPMHPFNNEQSALLHETIRNNARDYLRFYDLVKQSIKIKDLLENSRPFPGNNSAWQRTQAKKIMTFLDEISAGFTLWLRNLSNFPPDQADIKYATKVLRLWRFLQVRVTERPIDSSFMQTFLNVARSTMMPNPSEPAKTLGLLLSQVLLKLDEPFRLKTGQSMDLMWESFATIYPRSEKNLLAAIQLENLSCQLGKYAWSSGATTSEVKEIRAGIMKAILAVSFEGYDASGLIGVLSEGVGRLKKSTEDVEDESAEPFLKDQFEMICQLRDLHVDSVGTQTLPDYDRLPAYACRFKINLNDILANAQSTILKPLALLKSMTENSRGNFSILLVQNPIPNLFTKLNAINKLTLARLEKLQPELDSFNQEMIQQSRILSKGFLPKLNGYLRVLIHDIMRLHQNFFSEKEGFTLESSLPKHHYFREIYERLVEPCFQALESVGGTSRDALLASSKAWKNFALAALLLYVPDTAFDPAYLQSLRLEIYLATRDGLDLELAGLISFEKIFTGKETSLRIAQAKDDIAMIGLVPPPCSAVRPITPEIDALQGNLFNLLNIVQLLLKDTEAGDDASQHLLMQSLHQIKSRLLGNFHYYRDITWPVSGFVSCLQIGMSLALTAEQCQQLPSIRLEFIYENTPFLSCPGELLTDGFQRVLSQSTPEMELGWHILDRVLLTSRVEHASLLEQRQLDVAWEVLDSFFAQWKEKLQADQARNTAESSLYQFRGTDDEKTDEEYDKSLFPDYEEEEGKVNHTGDSPAALARRLSIFHAGMFSHNKSAESELKTLLLNSAGILESETSGSMITILNGAQKAMPILFLKLKDCADGLIQQTKQSPRNFYFDQNITEAKKFILLIRKVKARFRELRNAWPEHATLSDTLHLCDEALSFRYSEPVAKFLSKAEKVHGFVHEWQKVASREYSAAALYDELTGLIVGWRQLELTTWERLLDLEEQKCADEANSWWFVAYETIIAATRQLGTTTTDVSIYIVDLLTTLESFFASTTLGQYRHRIRLLQHFASHLRTLTAEHSHIQRVVEAFENVITYFSRFENSVARSIESGRRELEKEIKDVIKLASWRDTTIEALRQSARNSHHKLTKLARKFRQILNRPCSTILNQDIERVKSQRPAAFSETLAGTAPDPNLDMLCRENVPGWDSRPARLRHLINTISLMRQKIAITDESVDGSAHIESLLQHLEVSIDDLRKQTPSMLTKENEEKVKHLKVQKRKLFADTLKELRQMGFHPNISSNVLSEQSSLAAVLANMGPSQSHGRLDTAQAESYIYRALQKMPAARNIAKEHSGDLNASDIARSIGYLESLLYLSIRQRRILSSEIQALSCLDESIAHMESLWKPRDYSVTTEPGEKEYCLYLEKRLRWVSVILKVGADIVNAQADLGKRDLDPVIWSLSNLTAKVDDKIVAAMSLPRLPHGISSTAHKSWIDESIRLFKDAERTVQILSAEYPLTECILGHILPWVGGKYDKSLVYLNGEHQSDHRTIDLGRFWNNTQAAVDSLLSYVQSVEVALLAIPKTTDEPSWLSQENKSYKDAIKNMRISRAQDLITNLISSLRLPKAAELKSLEVAAAALTTILPIIKQYRQSSAILLSRYLRLHENTARLLQRLCDSFALVGREGFCMPTEKSTEPGAQNEKLEAGTGLGEGEGAEDISKDIEDDEDLSELARQPDEQGKQEDIEEEEEAVDMGGQEMEGAEGEAEQKEDAEERSENGDEDDLEDEVGDVDDLGPSAVDEKMWDDGADNANKDKEADQAPGAQNKDERVTAQGKEENVSREVEQESDASSEAAGVEEPEQVGNDDAEKADPHMKEGETLDLPDEMDFGDDQQNGGDDDEDPADLSDLEDAKDVDEKIEEDNVVEDIPGELEADMPGAEEDAETNGAVEDEESKEKDTENLIKDEVEATEDAHAIQETKNDNTATEQTADAGAGLDANNPDHQDSKDQDAATKQEDGLKGDSARETQSGSAGEGGEEQSNQRNAVGRDNEAEETPERQSFRKLGDALEQWFNQQRQIRDAQTEKNEDIQKLAKDADMADADFEHLADEQAQADAQAKGTASEDQVKAMDDKMAVASNEMEQEDVRMAEDVDDDASDVPESSRSDPEAGAHRPQEQKHAEGDTGSKAFVGERARDEAPPMDHMDVDDNSDTASAISDVETQLSTTHLDPSALRSRPLAEARTLWSRHESATRTHAQSLAERLRLVLEPTTASKLRGDFRTGKRLNLKRIVPFVASGFRRDKIWLRRSAPSKRAHQVMLALDDSHSMAESGAAPLALDTLALVARALTILEAGELCVAGFGEDVAVAHEFGAAFGAEAGAEVVRRLTFSQGRTNVRRLLERALEVFAEARLRRSGGGSEELWQLMMVVSDGVCDEHDAVRRLVRRAQEERVMVVFVIVDAASGGGGGGEGVSQKRSILDLQSVDVTAEGKVVKWRYMDRFPFKWYLVVRDVAELPGVLATALRQWFGEVAEAAG